MFVVLFLLLFDATDTTVIMVANLEVEYDVADTEE